MRLQKRLIATSKPGVLAAGLPVARPYKNQSTASLINSLAVFNLCAVPPLVDHFPTIINIANKTGTSPILHAVVKQTFFKHFCGGENLKEVVPTMEKMAQSNVGAILDLAIEADLDAADLVGEAAQLATRQMVNSLKECIDIAAHQPDSFIAAKVTALSPPSLLLSWTTTLRKLESTFDVLADKNGNVCLEQFKKLKDTFPGLEKLDMAKLFKENDLNGSGTLSFADVSAIFSLFNIPNCRALVLESKDGHKYASDKDLDTAALIIPEIKLLCEYAREKKVKLMMDAEQSYFQAAIDDVVIGLCRLYNTRLSTPSPDKYGWKGPLVFNTYQMYLTSSLGRLKTDVARASQRGYSYGVKLVRGAYMVSERERAMRLGQPSPIHATLEDTHKAYDEAVAFLIEQQAASPRVADSTRGLSFVVASHNHNSVKLTRNLMDKHGIPRSGGWVGFGQLMGMQDGVTAELAANGFTAMKYVPYGPVPVAMAYLHRRAQENSAMIGGMKADKAAITKELKTRLGFA